MIKTIVSFTIILTVISLLPSVYAEVNLSSQSNVELKEEFSVNIFSDLSGIYDVKIYIRNESGAISSEIFDGNWKNGRFYINEAFPARHTFSLRAISDSSDSFLCVKLRLSEKRNTKPPTPESCVKITIGANVKEVIENKEEKKPVKKERVNNREKNKAVIIYQNISPKLEAPDTTIIQDSKPIPLNILAERTDSTSDQLNNLILFSIFFVLSIFAMIWLIRDSNSRRENI
ncbi:hypothetical protein FJZ18_03160 [Candidatus Pacearchaeota archaeon]|nr:hypothetical protein [Candidatus Pacearchaeota archaeon]